MAVTVEQIAKAAGVSRGTVDRVLHGRGRVNQEVVERVLQVSQELGYTMKQRTKRTNVESVKIGVITQLAKASFMLEVKRGIQQAATDLGQRGVELVIRESQAVSEKEQLKAIDELVSNGIKGLAIMPLDCASVRLKLKELVEVRGIPVVTFNSDIVGAGRSCFVGLDNRKSGAAAAGLMDMITRGGKILVITGYFSNNVNNLRVDGFMEEARSSFPTLETIGVQGSFDDDDEVQRIIENTMDVYPDLAGILMVSGGQLGIEKAFSALELTKRPIIIAYDLTPVTKQLLLDGTISFLIDQEGYVQGYRTLGILADLLQFGRQPETEYYFTDINIKTKYNI